MRWLLLGLVLVVTFVAGWVANDALRTPLGDEADRLKQQIANLEARLRGRGEATAARPAGSPGSTAATLRSAASRAETERSVIASLREQRLATERGTPSTGAVQPPRGGAADRGSSARTPSASAATMESALDRFHRYLEALNGPDGRERWQRARELVEELRGMGDAAGQALMHVLATGTDSEERRAAARLLGTLKVPESLPLLRQIIERDDDVLLRRAAASGLRQLQTPESMPVMEHMLTNVTEDRLVRLSAAVGLAESGRAVGVNGLAMIFHESTADGRGRELAFRALAGLNDERALPFMRQVVASDAEPAYRLRAIRYLAAQGDHQALATLQVVMRSPSEQPSIRDAAGQAYRNLGGK